MYYYYVYGMRKEQERKIMSLPLTSIQVPRCARHGNTLTDGRSSPWRGNAAGVAPNPQIAPQPAACKVASHVALLHLACC